MFIKDGPGKDKLLNGDEILAINDEDVEFASREHVISLIRKSVHKIKLVVKQPTVRTTRLDVFFIYLFIYFC